MFLTQRFLVRVMILFTLLAGLISSNLESHAQGTATVEQFRLPTGNHTIRYTPGIGADKDLVISALTDAITTYERLWGRSPTRMPIFLELLTVNLSRLPGDRLAEAGRVTTSVPDLRGGASDREVCLVRVSNEPALTNEGVLRFTVAHELAHCYQAYRIPGASPLRSDDEDLFWWIEGSAEWLASEVYPDYADAAITDGIRNWFVQNRFNSAINRPYKYDAYFFWVYLAQTLSREGVMTFLKSMPMDKAQYPDYVSSRIPNTAQVFRDWGVALAQGRIPQQPTPSRLRDEVNVATLPHEIRINMDSFNYSIVRLTMPPLEVSSVGRTIYQVEARGLAAAGVSATVLGGEPFTDGISYICDPTPELTFVFGTGKRPNENDATLLISSVVEGPDNCPPSIRLRDIRGAECLIGTWNVDPLSVWTQSVEGVRPTFRGFWSVTFLNDGKSVFHVYYIVSQKVRGKSTLGNTVPTDIEALFEAFIETQIVEVNPTEGYFVARLVRQGTPFSVTSWIGGRRGSTLRFPSPVGAAALPKTNYTCTASQLEIAPDSPQARPTRYNRQAGS